MAKVGYPSGLIRYSTQNAIDGQPTRVLRPRIVVYGSLLLALCIAWAWGVGTRSPLIVEALRDRNALYRETADGIANGYTLKLVNKGDAAATYSLQLESGLRGLAIRGTAPSITLAPQQVVSLPITVETPFSTFVTV